MSNRLETDIWTQETCAGCGLCVAVCSKQVLHWDGGEHPVREQRLKSVGYTRSTLDTCSFCEKFCEEACPRLERWQAMESRVLLSAMARGPIKNGSPNDVIRSILTAGRSAGLLDGVVMLDLDPWDLKPTARLAFSVEDIVEAVGPQYLWAPIFEVLNEAIFDRGMRNLAIVGTPCTAQAVRKIRQSSNGRLKPYQDALRLTISIFCTGVYRPEFTEEVIVKRLGVAHNQIKRLEISPDREWLRAVLWDDSVRTVPRQQAESYTRRGCGSCDDYLGESADLAVGALGAPEGTSTVIIRSRTGDIFVRNAVQMNLLETSFEVNEEALKAATSEKERRERAKAFKELRLLMLDALADPYKRGEAIQQFVRLYRTPAPANVQEIVRSSCTGC